MWGEDGVCRVLVGKPSGNKPFGRPRIGTGGGHLCECRNEPSGFVEFGEFLN